MDRDNEERLGLSDTEEKNAKCHICSTGLSYLENLFYGNRCLFDATKTQNVNLIQFLRMVIIDWQIYQALLLLKVRKGKKKGWELYIGCLGAIGYPDINDIKSVTVKRELLKELRRVT